jgi:hypothetical protein
MLCLLEKITSKIKFKSFQLLTQSRVAQLHVATQFKIPKKVEVKKAAITTFY